MEIIARRVESLSGSIAWVFFALNAKPTSMRRALAERLARHSSVVIVGNSISALRNHAGMPFSQRRRPLDGYEHAWRYQPMHYPERIPIVGKLCKRLNRRKLLLEVEALLPSDTPRIFCYDSPTQHSVVGLLGESLSVYLAIDDRTLTVTGEPIKGELEAEQELLNKVDSVICVSQPLADTLQSRAPRGRTLPIYVLPNGYDERIFNPTLPCDEPEAIRKIPRPRMLVSGHVSERIDWEGIAAASRLRPHWSWVFVGPSDAGITERISGIPGKRGFWHPQIALADVPAWIKHCDACAVPYRLNDFTCASSPLKAIEYLAMGIPVLSTGVPSLGRYGNVIQWVKESDGKSYAQALDACASVETEPARHQARRYAVKADSWETRVSQFKDILFSGNP